jgi:catechol 2,3-dioxygenase-like lactoylglutathione lyase family enzyme
VPCRLLALSRDARDPARVAGFWAGLLGRQVVHDTGGVMLPGPETELALRFVPDRAADAGPQRMHLHLTSSSLADQQRTVAAALALGARHLDVGQLPEEGHVVLADPEGSAFCVIEPGNAFLAGCGLLGELACDGGRDVGLFWAAALGWPLVWDQDQETAVQSPRGGTKIAWGGPSHAPARGRTRQRLHLAVVDADPAGEVDRLTGLGATRLGGTEDGAVLADPGGDELWLTRPPVAGR